MRFLDDQVLCPRVLAVDHGERVSGGRPVDADCADGRRLAERVHIVQLIIPLCATSKSVGSPRAR